jgi:membrane-bound serine protease (ClpP class)
MPTAARRSPRSAALIAAAAAWLLAVAGAASAAGAPAASSVVVLTATGTVDSVMAGYVEQGVALAEERAAPAVVVRLDTPGGSSDAMGRITRALLGSSVPTIVWVAPEGARAASAGTFITLAANLAYMAPGTNIGAASPVGSGGEDITGTLGEKVLQDAIAGITAIAQERGRPVDWAVSTVREARSYPAADAVAAGAVDGIERTLADVLSAADGRVVQVAGSDVTLALGGVATSEAPMNPFQALLHLLSDPNIAFLLFTLGFYGLLAELWHPNFVTGIMGGLAIILALVGFGSLPLNVAGLLLIGLAVILFALEPQITSHGLLTVGGAICFVLGASALYTRPSDASAPAVEVAMPVIVVMTGTTLAFALLIAWAVARSRRIGSGAITSGRPLDPGTPGEVRRSLAPSGIVRAGGEEWSARSADGRPIAAGTEVRVVASDGLTLVVTPVEASSGSEQAAAHRPGA